MTTSFRKEVIEWLRRQDVASKSNSGARNATAQTEEGNRPSTSAEGYTSISAIRPMPIILDQEMSRTASDRIRDILGLSRARQDYKKIEPFRVEEPYNLQQQEQRYQTIDPLSLTNPGSYEDKGLTRGIFRSSKERESEKEGLKDLTRMVGGC